MKEKILNDHLDEFANAERDDQDVLIDLYCDVLMAYMLVESALGECDLRTHLGEALDTWDQKRLESAWNTYQNLPPTVKAKIQSGDAEFSKTMLDIAADAGMEVATGNGKKKSGRKSA